MLGKAADSIEDSKWKKKVEKERSKARA